MTDILAQRIRNRQDLLGVILKMPAPGYVELVGALGFDVVVLDTEHGPTNGVELEHHLRAADSVGLPVLVRVSSKREDSILAALDAGATGVVIPHVSSGADAEHAVTASQYPPVGSRSMALTTRAGRQGVKSLSDHLATAQENTVVVVQIEDYPGAMAAPEIAGTPGVDAVWIGLNDMSLDYCVSRDLERAVFDTAVDSVTVSVLSSTAALAISPSHVEDLRSWRSRGASIQFVPFQNMAILGARQFLEAGPGA